MTVTLSKKDYIHILDATAGHPDKIFRSDTYIQMEGGLMPHKATCTIHAGMRCDCYPELEFSNEFLIFNTAFLYDLEGNAVT